MSSPLDAVEWLRGYVKTSQLTIGAAEKLLKCADQLEAALNRLSEQDELIRTTKDSLTHIIRLDGWASHDCDRASLIDAKGIARSALTKIERAGY